MKMDIEIPFSILSKNQNSDRYADPGSVQLSSCGVKEALVTLSLHHALGFWDDYRPGYFVTYSTSLFCSAIDSLDV